MKWILSNSVSTVVGCLVGGASALMGIGLTDLGAPDWKTAEQQFQALSPEQQSAVRLSYADFGNQPAERRNELHKIHLAVTDHDQLQSVLTRYYQWWLELAQEERALIEEASDAERSDALERIRARQETARAQIPVRLMGAGPGDHRRTTVISLPESETILRECMTDRAVPEYVSRYSEQGVRVLAMALWVSEILSAEYSERGNNENALAIVRNIGSRVMQTTSTISPTLSGTENDRRLQGVQLYIGIQTIDAIIDTLQEQLIERSATDEQLLRIFTEEFDDNERTGVMRSDPPNAKRMLLLHALESGADAENGTDSLVGRLAGYQKRKRAMFLRFWGNERGPGGRRPPGNDSERFGGPPNGGRPEDRGRRGPGGGGPGGGGPSGARGGFGPGGRPPRPDDDRP